jgi:hypothetical protein
MQDTLCYIRTKHGSVCAYLERIGFDASWQATLRQALDPRVCLPACQISTASQAAPAPDSNPDSQAVLASDLNPHHTTTDVSAMDSGNLSQSITPAANPSEPRAFVAFSNTLGAVTEDLACTSHVDSETIAEGVATHAGDPLAELADEGALEDPIV